MKETISVWPTLSQLNLYVLSLPLSFSVCFLSIKLFTRYSNNIILCKFKVQGSGCLYFVMAFHYHFSLNIYPLIGGNGFLGFSDFVYMTEFSGRLPKKSKVDRVLMCWWAFIGLTHIILEGYFVFAPEFFKDKTGFYLAEVCETFNLSLTFNTDIR